MLLFTATPDVVVRDETLKLPVWHAKQDCWTDKSKCDRENGRCNYCGPGGVCCRKGDKHVGPSGSVCSGTVGVWGRHACVPNPNVNHWCPHSSLETVGVMTFYYYHDHATESPTAVFL